jgi:hypothetical protein
MKENSPLATNICFLSKTMFHVAIYILFFGNYSKVKMYTITNIHTDIHTNTNTHRQAHKHKHTHTYTQTHIHIHTNTYTHKHTHRHTHTHSHTHTHTHTYTHSATSLIIRRSLLSKAGIPHLKTSSVCPSVT